MESYIKKEFMLMADSLVVGSSIEFCRNASKLDFSNLDDWVSHEQFNIYMNALREKVGDVGPSIVGKQIGKAVDKHTGALTQAGTVFNMLNAWPQIYSDNNTGSDHGFLRIENLESKSVDVITTSPLDVGFHLGVGEGFIRFYRKMVRKAELVTTLESHNQIHMHYEWV